MSSVAYIRPKSRTERPRKTKIGTEVGHVTRDSDTIFKVKRSEVNLQGAGAYCVGLPHSLLCAKIKATYLLCLRSPKASRYPAPLPVWYGRTHRRVYIRRIDLADDRQTGRGVPRRSIISLRGWRRQDPARTGGVGPTLAVSNHLIA